MNKVLATEVVDLIVFDLRLPSEDGMNLARKLRDESAIPIIMLTGRSDEADRVMGLELGADDYVTKPFSPRELLARIRTVLRRRRTEMHQGRPEGIRAYRFDGWELNLNTAGSPLRMVASPCLPRVSSVFWSCCSALHIASSAGTSSSNFRACTTTKSTTVPWTSRSCESAAR